MHSSLTITGAVAAGSTGVTLSTLFPEATPAVVICSLAGTALYVLSSRPHRVWRQILFALISFIGGIHSAETVSEIIAAVINAWLVKIAPGASVHVTPGIGALVASTICVSVLLRVMAKYQDGRQTKKGEEQ
ncbi:hypothetical protein NZZ21_004612 [Escherichia albertii]|uniref:putative holin n=1 Tax=Escherichia albertii TaxID=208962 RepID=UPI000CF717E3|nr:putative holin [Escherichia albertii]EFB5187769.1 hypothetical protein [Escherichia albertii]EJI9011332.1 hypothetical protein [Escherichia albertii]EJQ6148878.1 hypothetical protein [Escherichia albertii]MCZ9131662.1 putative holin [Escherichia albertii]